MVGQQLYGVPLVVPRTFYVDSSLPPDEAAAAMDYEGAHVTQVKRTLPSSAQPGYIYQACVSRTVEAHADE